MATIEEHPTISTGALGRAAQKKWFVTPRTAQDYIDIIIGFGWATNTNTALHITPRGVAALEGVEAALEPSDRPNSTAAPESVAPTTHPAPPPSPPVSFEAGGGDETVAKPKQEAT